MASNTATDAPAAFAVALTAATKFCSPMFVIPFMKTPIRRCPFVMWSVIVPTLTSTAAATELCARVDCVVVSVDYSLSKVHKFPRALHEVDLVCRWLRDHAATLGVDPDRLTEMTCPIGVTGIVDKAPAAIAVAVCAELLQIRSREAVARAVTQKLYASV